MEKLAKKLMLPSRTITNICAQYHLINKVYAPGALKKVSVNLPLETWDAITEIADQLQVDTNAVMVGFLMDFITAH